MVIDFLKAQIESKKDYIKSLTLAYDVKREKQNLEKMEIYFNPVTIFRPKNFARYRDNALKWKERQAGDVQEGHDAKEFQEPVKDKSLTIEELNKGIETARRMGYKPETSIALKEMLEDRDKLTNPRETTGEIEKEIKSIKKEVKKDAK